MITTCKNIHIRLENGDASGIRSAQFSTGAIRVYEVPRKQVRDFLSMKDSKKPLAYFLVGFEDGEVLPKVYAGESASMEFRLVNHQASKEKNFWTSCLIVLSTTDGLTKSHIAYLEHLGNDTAVKFGRCILVNKKKTPAPSVPMHLAEDCHEYFQQAVLLLTTLGFQFLTPPPGGIAKPLNHVNVAGENDLGEMYFLKGIDTEARGHYTNQGMLVLEGSRGRLSSVPSIKDTSVEKVRKDLVKAGVLVEEGAHLIVAKPFTLKTPSAAAAALLGRTSWGWKEWKTASGKTLDESVPDLPEVASKHVKATSKATSKKTQILEV